MQISSYPYRKTNIITIYLISKYDKVIIIKKLDVNQLDDSDEELAEILISSGLGPTSCQNPGISSKSGYSYIH